MKRLIAMCVGGLLATTVFGATFTVTNTNDSGAGSLRQAILDANGNAGLDTIAFSITGSGVHTIQPLSSMVITDPVLLDGFTQAGSSPNTLLVATTPSTGSRSTRAPSRSRTSSSTSRRRAPRFVGSSSTGATERRSP